jgi:hypothetical protein
MPFHRSTVLVEGLGVFGVEVLGRLVWNIQIGGIFSYLDCRVSQLIEYNN